MPWGTPPSLYGNGLSSWSALGGAVSGVHVRDQPIVASCGSGVTACALAFGLHLIGWPDAAVYDGSWVDWGAPGDTPVETGPAP